MNDNKQKISAVLSILRALAQIPGLGFLNSLVREADKANRINNSVDQIKKNIDTLKK